ncbi:MAG: hypothetical protein CMO55_13510 [Verrucomicrobiales bacterium]|nr:hypothetical protein [Verrucomicrobiales bacterium]
MKYFLLLLAALFPVSLHADDGVSVTVTVTNIPGAKGNLLVGLYNSPGSFTGRPMANSPKVPLRSAGNVTVTIDDVKPGTYAIAVIQDLNGNGKLDKSPLGMPKEPLAFSVINKIPKGKPKFKACAFTVADSDISMTIPLTLE